MKRLSLKLGSKEPVQGNKAILNGMVLPSKLWIVINSNMKNILSFYLNNLT